METLADVVTALDDPEQPVLRVSRVYDAREVRSRAYKTGNALRHRGVRAGSTVAVVDDRSENPLFCLLGAALLGARVRFDPAESAEARVLAGPTGDLGEYDLPTGGQRVGWGAPPDNPSWMHFERDVWSENPAFPEPTVSAGDGLLPDVTHGDALAAARSTADRLDEDDVVALRAPLSTSGTVVAGVVAPLLAGASILFPESDDVGTVAVSEGGAPEARVVDPTETTL
ncbi:hypothetical protein [Halobacterium zhouii]|uniref:hypothetical protein n=1 Tax=Halobacterium zhouii TaxID=2902624 RepID=UPI001E3FDA39|nr:hypothetical protein [Halobacterium zhouii]